MGDELFCSFCEKARHETRKLIAGPKDTALICDECVELCSEVIAEEEINRWGRRIAAPIIKARRWLRGARDGGAHG